MNVIEHSSIVHSVMRSTVYISIEVQSSIWTLPLITLVIGLTSSVIVVNACLYWIPSLYYQYKYNRLD